MALPFTQITSITQKLILKKMTEGVFTGHVVLERFRKNQELEEGGDQIKSPLMTVNDTGTTGGFYASRDVLPLSEYDGLSASLHEWRHIYESVVIYKPDIAKNAGVLGVLKLIDKKVRQAELAMKQRMIKGLLSDGTASTGALTTEQFDGLRAVIASSGTYGSISSVDLATWLSYVDDNSGTLRALSQAIVDKAYDQAAEEGQGAPTLGLMTKAVYTKFKGLLTGIQRTTRESTLNGLGHKGQALIYNGIDHHIENQMPESTLFYVDEEHFKLHVHKDHNMRRQTISDLETADALLERIFLYGNTVASERKYHSRVNDITI